MKKFKLTISSYINTKMKKLKLTVSDYISIGVMGALAKSGATLIALIGGGMNPLTMILSNLFHMVILSALLVKVKKPFTLTLSYLTGVFISAFVMGNGVTLIPFILLASLIIEIIIYISSSRYKRLIPLVLGIFLAEASIKGVGLLYLYWQWRESPAVKEIVIGSSIFVGIALIGSFLGIFASYKFIKELRRASLIFN